MLVNTQRLSGTHWAALGLALIVAGCQGDSAESLLTKAKSAIESRDSKTAVIHLKNALQEDAKNAEARFLMGKLLLAMGDYRGASIELKKAAELGFNPELLAPLQAQAMLSNGEAVEVLSRFGDFKLSSKESAIALQTTLAAAQLSVGRRDEATALVNASLMAEPRHVPALLLKSRLLAAERNLDEASALLARALEADPRSAEAHKLKGDLLRVNGRDLAGAEAAYRDALKADPAFMEAHDALIWLAIDSKDLASAQARLDVLKSVAPGHANTLFLAGVIALDKGDLKLAHETVQQLLKQASDNPRALQLAGAIDLRRGSLAQAAAALGKANSLAPDNPRIRLLLAQTQLRTGEAAKAAKTLQPLMEKNEPSADVVSLMAEAQLQLGELAKAEALYARAASLNPKDMRSRTALAVAMVGKGQLQKGIDELRSIAAADPSPMADLALVTVLLRRKEHDQAMEAAGRLQRKLPKSAMVAALPGEIELSRGKTAQARTAYEAAIALDPAYFPAHLQLAKLDVVDGRKAQALQRLSKLADANPAAAELQLAVFALRKQMGTPSSELIEHLVIAVRASPGNADLRLALIKEHMVSANGKAAVAVAQEGVAALPESRELVAALGRAQSFVGDVNQALITLGKLVPMAPNSPQPFMELADVQLTHGDTAAAVQSLKKALMIAPDFVPAQSKLMAVEIAAGRYSEAVAIAKQIQLRRPGIADGFVLEGDVHAQRGNWQSAVAAYRAGFIKQPDTVLSMKLHSALVKAAKPEDAERHSKEWLRRQPGDAVYLNYQGDVAMQRNDLPGARRSYERALAIEPQMPAALNNLAWLLNRLKQPGALGLIDKAIQLVPGEATFYDTRAEIYADEGDFTKAIEAQQMALKLAPQAHPYRLRLARLYIAAGQGGQAKQELDTLAKLGAAFPQHAQVKELQAKL